MIDLALLLLATIALTLFAAAAMAMAETSRVALETRLRRRGRERWIRPFEAHPRDLALTMAFSALFAAALGAVVAWRRYGLNDAGWSGPILALATWLVWAAGFGLTLPRAIARHRGEALLAATLPAIDICRRLCLPLLLAGDLCDELVRRLAGASSEADAPAAAIGREILDVVSEAQQSGAVGPTQTRVIRSVIDLNRRTVGEIMTPRTEIVAVDAAAGLDEVRASFVAGGHSRMPIFEGSIDNVIGVLYAKDLLAGDRATNAPRERMRPVPFVPESKVLPELLREFQQTRVHMAIVLDEYGGTAGLVTLEDILEELVGEIADEHEGPVPQSIRKLDDHTAEVEGRVRVDELNAALGLSLPIDEAFDTVAGLVLSRLGRIPAPGESIACEGAQLSVIDSDARRIVRLRVQLPAAAPVGA